MKVRKRYAMMFLAVVLAAAAAAQPAAGETLLWKVEKDGATVYLGGTIHLLRQTDYPLPGEYDSAYDGSDVLVFETDLGALEDPGFQARVLSKAALPEGKTLDGILSAEAWKMLEEHCLAAGIPVAAIKSFRPGLVAVTLTAIEFQKLGITEEGIDKHFYDRANEDGKGKVFLETVDEQIGYLLSMGEGYEDEFIMHGLEEMEETAERMEDLIGFWRAGEDDSLAVTMIDPVMEDYPELYESMFVSRNEKWLPVIEGFFDTPETEFVLVGAAHLIGEDGIIAGLERSGYKVSREAD